VQAVVWIDPMDKILLVCEVSVKGQAILLCGVKEETHAARWGLLRGYSGKTTKWVDFVVANSTRRESCHSPRVLRNGYDVKQFGAKNVVLDNSS
jgi:hypothetical protein